MQQDQQKSEFAKNWKRVNPLEDPIANDFPKHNPEKFENYIEVKDNDGKVIGFTINDVYYVFDENQGWRDENGCYYNKDGEAAGWFVLHPGDVYQEHFYDADGYYVPSDAEESESDHEAQEVQEEGEEQNEIVQILQ
ncbi:hypothetical protein pb186bvf_018607 [Paramecium bursaria]